MLIFTFVPTTHYLAFDRQTFLELSATKLIGVMAGIYIIVRGLDNVDRGLPLSWRPHWDRAFPKQKRDTQIRACVTTPAEPGYFVRLGPLINFSRYLTQRAISASVCHGPTYC